MSDGAIKYSEIYRQKDINITIYIVITLIFI